MDRQAVQRSQVIQCGPGKIKYFLTGKNIVPSGVTEMRDLGGGYGIGYDKAMKRIVLYDPDETIAHVDIQEYPQSHSILLHTGTDSGSAGGHGYMAMMFPEALKIVQKEYSQSQYQQIEMTPAPGAATKGLISQLSRLRAKMPLQNPSRFAGPRMVAASTFLNTADTIRATRKEEEKKEKEREQDPHAWNGKAMLETAHELNALTAMEYASPTGLEIMGLSSFTGFVVGPRTRPLSGGAFEWYRASEKHGQGMLHITIPMAAIGQYIAVLS